MSSEPQRELREVRGRAREAAGELEARAAEALELAKEIENLTDGTPDRYPGMRARVEARETLRQARLLVRTLEHLDERTRARG